LHGDAADGIIGSNTGLRNVKEMVHQVAPLNSYVLILGETGTRGSRGTSMPHFVPSGNPLFLNPQRNLHAVIPDPSAYLPYSPSVPQPVS